MPKTFVLSDESLNSYGFRVMTAGIDLEDFIKNPIMLWNHSRSWRGTKDEVLPIGRWTNIRKEGGKLLADAEFDMNDEFAAKIAAKVEAGFLKATSVGIRIVEMSEDPKYLLPGQTRPSATKSKVKEASITDIPSNSNALALYDADDNLVALSAGADCPVPLLSSLSQSNIQTEMNELQNVAALLGCEANLSAVSEAINKLRTEAGKVITLTAQLEQYRTAEATRRKAEIETQLSDAVKAGKITEAQKPHFAALFDANYDSTKAILDAMTPTVSLSDFVKPATPLQSGSSNELKYNGKTFAELERENPTALAELKERNLPLFEQMFEQQYRRKYRHTVRP